MKKLIIINGTPGVGKTTTAKQLNEELSNSVWLDGDWCWMMSPFIVNDENKEMVESNIAYMLNNFINSRTIEHIVFSWVIPHDALMRSLLDALSREELIVYKITLVCDERYLRERLLKEGRATNRIEDSIRRQQAYLPMDTVKLETSRMSVNEVIEKIGELIE